MNQVFLTGKLGEEPELKKTTGGTVYLKNSIGVWRPSKDKTAKDSVDFIPFFARGSQAEFIKKYVKKNARINIGGRLQITACKDKDGNETNRLDVIAEKIEFGIRGQSQEV